MNPDKYTLKLPDKGMRRGKTIARPILGLADIMPTETGTAIRIKNRGIPLLRRDERRLLTEPENSMRYLKYNIVKTVIAISHLTPFLRNTKIRLRSTRFRASATNKPNVKANHTGKPIRLRMTTSIMGARPVKAEE